MTPTEINALPERVRLYIHALETNADPAGMVQENVLLKDQTRELDAMIAGLKDEIDNLQERLQRIEQWCKAYPRDIFIEPMKKQWAAAAITLKNDPDCPSLDAISGSNMRHVVEGLMAQAKDWEA